MDSTLLSQDQKQVLTALLEWTKQSKTDQITVGGYAGTGKTTLIALLSLLLKKSRPQLRIAFASFTGKASQILATQLKKAKALSNTDFCGTLHSLMYLPQLDKEGRIKSWRKNHALSYELIVIDEASMVSQDLWTDLLAYKIPIIAVGDHGQLPPIGDSFNLMSDPQLRLERIHRQAQTSPIIELATMARELGQIPTKRFAKNVVKTTKVGSDAEEILNRYFSGSSVSDTLVLCGRNKTRVQLNSHLRGLLGYTSTEPKVGDSVICLKNNYDNTDGPIYNGMIGRVKRLMLEKEHWYKADIDFPTENRLYSGTISKHQFNQETFVDKIDGVHYSKIGDRFDFGYALTVHKAQGSQAETVILFEERSQYWSDDDWRRWLYTAITRAQENLYILA